MKQNQQKYFLRSLLIIFLILSLFGLTPVKPAHAATLLVTKAGDTDDGTCNEDCSLREAIEAASSGDTIRFSTALIGATIVLNDNELVIDKNLTIAGHGPTRLSISGNQSSRVLRVGSNRAVTISGLTIRDGVRLVPLDSLGGGGILNQGNLTLIEVVIRDNRVEDDGGAALGGGIHNDEGDLTIRDSAIINNRAVDRGVGGCFGGGIANTGDMRLTNVTISGNRAEDNGNYCFGAGLDHTEGELELEFVTIANNVGTVNGGQMFGGGISQGFGFISMRNTMIANNQPSNCDLYETTEEIESGGYNFESTDTCAMDASTDIVNTAPQLGALQDNGGSTPTHALDANSPAVDRIPNGSNGCQSGVSVDQRGAVRAGGEDRGGPACDIGAYEYDSNQRPTALTTADLSVEQKGLPVWVAGLSVLLVLGLLGGLLLTRRRLR